MQTALSNLGLGEIDLSSINKLLGTNFGNIKLGIELDSPEYDKLIDQIRDAESGAITAETEQVKNLHEQETLRAQELEETYNLIQATGNEIERQNKETYTNIGAIIPEEEQQKVITNLNTQKLIVNSLIKEYENLADKNRNDDGEYNTYGQGYIEKAE